MRAYTELSNFIVDVNSAIASDTYVSRLRNTFSCHSYIRDITYPDFVLAV